MTLAKQLIVHLTCDTENIVVAIERVTVRQSVRKRWHEERYGRLTASNFGRICKAQKIAIYLLYSSASAISSSAIQAGETRQQHSLTLSTGYSVEECGIFISVVVAEGDSNPKGIVEIRCPFSLRLKSSLR